MQYVLNLLDPIMLADDTDFFLCRAEENIKTSFDKTIFELQKISQWFISNKLSLNVTKPNSHFFINPGRKKIFS